MRREQLDKKSCAANLTRRPSIGEVQPRKNRAPFPAITVVDPSDDIGSNDSTESDTRGHAVIPKGDVPVVIEHLTGVQERCDLEIRANKARARKTGCDIALRMKSSALFAIKG